MFKLLKGLLLLMKQCNEIHIATQKLSWFMMSNIFKGTLYKGGLISKILSLWLKSLNKNVPTHTPEHYFLWSGACFDTFLKILNQN